MSTPVDMCLQRDYLFSKTDSNGTVVRKYLNRIYYYMRNGHNGVNGDYLDAASDDALSVISSESDVYNWPSDVSSASIFINSGYDLERPLFGDSPREHSVEWH